MNLERVSNEEKLNLCRKYYLGKGRYPRGGGTRAPDGRGSGGLGSWVQRMKWLGTPILWSQERKGLSLAEGGDWDLNFWVPKEKCCRGWTPGSDKDVVED